jgi:outer membrane lipase/esterase
MRVAPLLFLACLALAPRAAAQGVDDLVAFGNSLTDDGNAYRLTLLRPEGPIPPSPPYFEGRFSNGPVWVERLAPLVGASRLDDRAFGGAETGFGLVPPGVRTQVAAWLGGGNLPGGADLLVVWGGGNDYRFGFRSDDPAGLVGRTVDNLGAAAEALAAAGGREILVPNLPDLGATPEARMREAAEPGTAARLTALSRDHNARLAARVEELRRRFPGTAFRLLDVDALFRAIREAPGAYGLSNLETPCLLEVPPGEIVPSGACPTPEAASASLFFDPVHPTAAAHDLLARHAAAFLAAPGEGAAGSAAQPGMGLLSGSALGRAVAERLAALRGLGGLAAGGLFAAGAGGGSGSGGSGGPRGLAFGPQYASADPEEVAEFPDPGLPGGLLPRARPDPDRPFGVFVHADRRWGDRGAAQGRAGFSYRETSVAAGADYRVAPGLVLGAAVGHGRGRASLSGGAGSAELRSLRLGAYGGLELGDFHLDADLSYAFDDYPSLRRLTGMPVWPVAEADTSGRTVSAGLEAGYDLRAGFLTLTPYAGLDWARTRVEGYEERSAGPYAVRVGGQSASALTAELGARLAARVERDWGAFEPRFQLGYRRELRSDLAPATVSLGGVDTAFPRAPGDRDHLVAGLGLAVDLASGAELAAAYEGTLARSDGRDHRVTAGLRLRF